jgi:hypothetical protein
MNKPVIYTCVVKDCPYTTTDYDEYRKHIEAHPSGVKPSKGEAVQ